ncbi:uncharacterized protein LOC113360618 [Papaver somniferum]|uniref:uncharacterized protein LOC113360618 n=1 Tax=Papaver somniferum TaxID=3469 RepID=UPI000E6FD413|nr:uncharacterized protein LOC113360618 [Papaver somniferum]
MALFTFNSINYFKHRTTITVRVGDVLVTGIHVACLTVDRRELWEELLKINALQLPWLVLGDFNTVLSCLKTGIQFSWCNDRVGKKRILCDLDKAFFNTKWLDLYTTWNYKVGVRGVSDHGPLLGGTTEITKPQNIPFRYQPIWTSHPEFLQLIKESSKEECVGNPAFNFMSKLKRFKIRVKQWNWEFFGDLRIKVKETEDEVLKATLLSDAQPENVTLLNYLVTARGKHELEAQQYSELLRSKSRIKCVKEGGANTSFFHTSMKVRNAHNNIAELEDSNGNIVVEQNQIADLLVNHFQKKFEHQEVSHEESFFNSIPKVITEEDNVLMDTLPSTQEIKDVGFSMDPTSSPGPDRFPEELNSGQLQGAFIKGRNIQEKIVLALELVNELDTKRRGRNVGLNLDITQSFDSMSWEFIFKTLKHFGFSQVGINWLKIIFGSARISLLVNGWPFGFFEVGRGLGQGDPLSPILFVIAEEVLSRNLTKMIQEGLIQTMVNRKGCQPSHLMFADDIFISCNGHKRTLDNLMGLLMKYQVASGQIANRAKSRCFVGGVTEERRLIIAERLQMELSEFPDKYLGVILCHGRVKTAQVWGIAEMLQKQLAGWIGKLLAFSDRLILVKFVLCNIPIYNMSVYKWPKSMIKKCERIIRNFLWTGDPYVKKLITVKWEEVNAPFVERGLGLRRLEVVNKALLLKLL